ncbi:MAG: hypothetical protein GY815_17580 [Gammaproteobacteria bacterium]|nr:hypothetical protein [Gammaproteobacteria bacterium]
MNHLARHAWIALCASLIAPLWYGGAAAATIDQKILPATGRQETIAKIPDFGRYALISQSEQGTALRYINKMSGPSQINGKAGEADGRIDAFLDIGDYKLVTYADDKGSGEVKLTVQSFTEINGELAPQLLENRLVSAALSDFEQRSYWIHVKSRQTVLIEAAGRSLGDLRLWGEGNWLIDIEPRNDTVEPDEGKPLRVKQVAADLNPGFYLLVAYGGPSLPWAETSGEQPFHMRMGIPRLAANGVDNKVTSPFGYDRWLVSDATDYFRLELEQNTRASINVSRFDDNYAFSYSGRSSEITKESRLPVAEVFASRGRKENFKVVTISTGADRPYTFQRFAKVRHHVIDKPGTYWVSTLHSGYGEDSPDATSLLTDITKSRGRYVDSRAILLRHTGWQRRFNILDNMTLIFEVQQRGDYRVEADGIEGEFRFEPLTSFRGNNYKTPKARNLGDAWSLDRGYYVLTVMPDRDARGVATLSVYTGNRKPDRPSPAQTSSLYTSVKVDWEQRYRLEMNTQPGVVSGILVRKYPLDMTDSMSLPLGAGKKMSLRIKVPGDGELAARTEDDHLINFRLNQSGSLGLVAPVLGTARYPVTGGLYDLRLYNNSDRVQNYQLHFTAAGELAGTALPSFDQGRLDHPDFPELTEQQARYLDLKARQWAGFNVIVDQPGLYKLESTGLLQTRGSIRTRVNPRLDQQSNNGVGRNFLIQQYLREGKYQLALSPEGSTEGHLGVRLRKTALNDGGRIEDGIAARYSLASGEGLVYRFTIPRDGKYRLQSFGTNGHNNARLEDGDGWPLVKPGARADLNTEFHAGEYRIVVLPGALSARVVTLLERIDEPPEYEGHGPFVMDLNQRSYSHTWMEPIEGEARKPDVWTFELPAPATTSLNLSEGMEATLTATSAGFTPANFTGTRPLRQTLPAGQYRIEARARRNNNRFDYRLDLALEEMVVGQRRVLSVPAEINIAVGRDSLIEFSSFGTNDVKAQLFDAEDKLLTSNDDRVNDWNFDIVEPLVAGRYRLAVRPVGKPGAQTMIRMSEPESLATTDLALPAEFSVNKPMIHSYSIDLDGQSGVFAVAAESRDSVSLTLEKRNPGGVWQSLATAKGSNALLLAAIDNATGTGKRYRLKIWSPEQRGAEILVAAGMMTTRVVDEAAVTQGVKLRQQARLSRQIAAVGIVLATPGMFVAPAPGADRLYWAAVNDSQLQPYDGFISGVDKLWLVALDTAQPLRTSRVLLQDQTLLINIAGDTEAWIDSATTSQAQQLFIAEARVGLPGIGVLDGNRFDARQMGVGQKSSIVLANAATDNSLRLKVWNTAASNTVLPVRIRRYGFESATVQDLRSGSNDTKLGQHGALSFKLNGSLQGIRFNLPRGVAAVFSKDGKTLRSFWADRDDQNYQLWSDADRLQLLNTTATERVLNIKASTAQNHARLAQGEMFKHHFPNAGVFSLALSDDVSEASIAAVYGDTAELMVQNSAGRVVRGSSVPISGDTVASLAHGAGLAVAWLSRAREFTGATDQDPTESGELQLSGASQTLAFERSRAGFINLQSATPVIARIQRSGLHDEVRVYETGINTTLFLPRGKSRLRLQAVTSQSLHGVLHLAEVPEVELIEGLGERVGLLPGDTRVYRFSLEQKQDIGIGVQASIDVARAYLFNQHGEILGAGVTQKHALGHGTYYLMIELPPETGAAVDMKPAIVGLEPPDSGPSREIMLEYQKYSSPEAL